MNEEAAEHYKKRNDWHKTNTPLVAAHFNNKCQFCSRPTNISKGAIHHLQYTGNDYKKTYEKLIEDKAITWICKECHKLEHIAYTTAEVNYKTKHSGYCALCNSFSWYGWYKRSFGRVSGLRPDDFPLCNPCIEVLVKNKVLIRGFTNIDGYEMEWIRMSDLEKLEEKAKILLAEINKKVDANLFGDRTIKEKWQGGFESQLDMF